MGGKDKHYLNWITIENLVNTLHRVIIESEKKFDNIYGLPRGGLIPAVMLSHKMKIPLIQQKEITSNTLIVDDICDSGETLDKLIKKYQTLYSFPFNLKTAVLHYKPHTSIIEPTFYACKFKSDDWVVYPWENKDSKPIQDYMQDYKIKVGSK